MIYVNKVAQATIPDTFESMLELANQNKFNDGTSIVLDNVGLTVSITTKRGIGYTRDERVAEFAEKAGYTVNLPDADFHSKEIVLR